MPEIDGLELLRRIKASSIALPVIVMTGHGDVPLAVEAMKRGARDFLEKPFRDDTFLEAIRAALQDPCMSETTDPAVAKFKTRANTLSPREKQVLEGLINGQANKVIAATPDISPRTIEIYRAKLMSKMQASSLSELIRLAVRAGLA